MKIFSRFVVATLLFIAVKSFAEKIPLELPPVVYAVPGIETNIYFDNLVLTTNPNNYVFDVDCKKGRNDEKRWRFTPSDKDVGSYKWAIKVIDSNNKIIASGTTKIIVSSKDAGKDKEVSMLIIGDSLTNATVYPRAIHDLMTKSGITLTMIGAHSGGGRKPNKIAHEGYGGWKWQTFCTRWSKTKDYRAKSHFLTLKNGKPVLDVKAYIKKYAKGKNPDFITIMLGTNDVFGANDNNIKEKIKTIFSFADKFIAALKKDVPNAKIGVALPVPPAASQDAFGSNYKCKQTRWQYRRNQFKLVEDMIAKYGNGKVENVSLIPAFVGIDCDNNFPMRREKTNSHDAKVIMRHSNGVHPASTGYKQLGDVFYCWLKYKLSEKKENK